jgi:hypothetical protein
MNGTERYVRQATRGLSGQARSDARMELRGAIEDKAWRLTLLGLEPQEAARAALRDLGSPHAIASGLTRVHTLPKAALAAVLAGVATLLGVQALAAVPTVRAAPDPTYKFCSYDEASLKQMPSAMQAEIRVRLAQPGGRDRLEADCKASSPVPFNSYLRLSDLINAFIAGGVGVRILPGRDGFIYLTFPKYGSEKTVDLSLATEKIAGQTYVQSFGLINSLKNIPDVPLRLTGKINPVLEIGPSKVQLGTLNTPVFVSELYMSALWNSLGSNLHPGSKNRTNVLFFLDDPDQAAHHMGISAPEDSFFVTVSNEAFILPEFSSVDYAFRILSVKDGLLPAPFVVGGGDVIVNTPAALFAATTKKQPAILVYKLDTSDLRNLKLTPVPASQIKVLPAR